jgi:RHS repeat-associated protein
LSVNVNGTPLLTNISFEPFGSVNGWTWGNGATVQRAFDQNGRITKTTLPELPAAYHYFDYDQLNRLTRAETIDGDLIRYDYDQTGNRTAKTVNGEEFVYTSERQSNRLIRVEGASNLFSESYDYDENGSTTSRTTQGQTDSFQYDEQGRLIQASGTLYKVNALGLRVEKQNLNADIHFVYDEQGHLIGEYDPVSGAPLTEHVWLNDMPVAAIKNGNIYYVYADHLNTPRAITDTNNNVVWYWNYDEPFGKTEANENPNNLGTFSYNLRFPGQYFDTETGLHYNWHRDYDPEIGKYIQSDPIGLERGINTYAYVKENPIGNSDIMGLVSFTKYPKPESYPRCVPWPDFPEPCHGKDDCKRACAREMINFLAACMNSCKRVWYEPATWTPQGTAILCAEAEKRWGEGCAENCQEKECCE